MLLFLILSCLHKPAMTPTLFLLATILHLAPALWMAIYTGLDATWDAVAASAAGYGHR